MGLLMWPGQEIIFLRIDILMFYVTIILEWYCLKSMVIETVIIFMQILWMDINRRMLLSTHKVWKTQLFYMFSHVFNDLHTYNVTWVIPVYLKKEYFDIDLKQNITILWITEDEYIKFCIQTTCLNWFLNSIIISKDKKYTYRSRTVTVSKILFIIIISRTT